MAKVKKVDSCSPYQAATISKAERFEPLRMTLLPNIPWKELTMDFPRPLPCGEYLTVVIDKYSCFPEVDKIQSVTIAESAEKYVNFVMSQVTPKAPSREEISEATRKDGTLQEVMHLIPIG